MFEFRLPDVGEGLHEAEVVRWLVRPGDSVRLDQSMVEVQTDKAVVEIGAPVPATVARILVPEGQRVPVGTVLVTLIPLDGAAPAAAPAAEPPAAGAQAVPGADASGPILAAPSVRKAARDRRIDLAQVRGTGPSGRIMLADLEAFATGQVTMSAAVPATLAPTTPAPITPAPATPVSAPPDGTDEIVPLQGLRRRTAERLRESWRTIPHVTSFEEADAERLNALRARLAPGAQERGVKLTLLSLVIKAVVVALKEHPYLNAVFDEAGGCIVLKRSYHIGVATATPDGLLVPVVRDADRKSTFAIAAELQRLAEGARSRKLTPAELAGSTFTITNFGAFGGYTGTPIINPPEVAILGVGKLSERPVVRDGQVVACPTLPLALSFDHRVIDGEGAGHFLNRLMALLADPELLLMELV